jgi:hypothetical protein
MHVGVANLAFGFGPFEGVYDLERSVGYKSGYHVLDHLPRGAEEAAMCPGQPLPHYPEMVRWGVSWAPDLLRSQHYDVQTLLDYTPVRTMRIKREIILHTRLQISSCG